MIFLKNIFIFKLSIYLGGCAHVNAGARGVQKKLLDPLALKLPTVVTHLMWLLAAEPKSLTRSVCTYL